jgi:RNA polymerase sigma-70 factor, ECF subfamily
MYDHLTVHEMADMARPSTVVSQDAPTPAASQRSDLAQRQEQFEALAMPIAGSLYTRALRLGGNHAYAEDLVQETLLCAWRNFDRFAMGTCFRAWVFQILRFVACNRRRSAASRQLTMDFQDDDSLLGSKLQEEQRVERVDTNWESVFPDLVDDTLKHALDCLSPDQRTLALRIPLGGLSYQECADELGIPVGTIMSRYWRARTRLRQELRRNGVQGICSRNTKLR